eukprot:TRINITY_DN2684_c0_g1_i2.p1 TRINITY_DN2684_c0_g1~~TRINITY_DN2684_c0_g1_i2.p1  ORF type:complete len:225 (+),score=39.26 TRINITY_DN2684_c0_g1_i2:100-675(+)
MKQSHVVILVFAMMVIDVLAIAEETEVNNAALKGHMEPIGNQGEELEPFKEVEGFMDGKQFLIEHVFKHKPLVFRQAINHWPARTRWLNDTYLAEKCGDQRFNAEWGKKEDRSLGETRVTMKQFLDVYKHPDKGNLYLLGTTLPKVLKGDFALPTSIHCEECLDHFDRVNMWFSSGGTKSKWERYFGQRKR